MIKKMLLSFAITIIFVMQVPAQCLTGVGRDRSVLSDSYQVLVIIDGEKTTQTDFNKLNPTDIESLTVIKKDSAVALYGSEGVNGVLIVVTKKKYEVSMLSQQDKKNVDIANEVKVSPNPSLGVFNVDFGALNVSKSVARVYNVQGATVHTSKVSNNMSISLENLPAGLYFLEVSTEKGSILKKLVKE